MSTATITAPVTTPAPAYTPNPAYALEPETPQDILLIAMYAQYVAFLAIPPVDRTELVAGLLADLPGVIRRVAELADRPLCDGCDISPHAARQSCCGMHVCEAGHPEHDDECAAFAAELAEEGDIL